MFFTRRVVAASFLLALIARLPLVHLSPTARHSQTIPDRRFGVIETYDDPVSASALGAGWTRVRFAWADLQPNNDGEWNNAFFSDERLAAERAAGREVVGLIVNTPFWALDDASVPGVPRGLYLPETDPGNVWATFVRQIVTRYAGRVDRWIVWNEPDIWDPAYPGRTWGGSVQEFFQLQRIAYNTARAANPNAQIHLGAFTYFWDVNFGRTPFFSLLLDEIQKDPQAPSHNYYFDAASANLYFDPDNIFDLIAWHHAQMRQRGFDKPVWLTETNAAPSTDPAWPVSNPAFVISLGEQAAFMPVAFAMAIAGGADRVGVYKMIDTAGDRAANPEPFGLVRDDGSRRPAFTGFQVAANYLSGFTGATLDHRDNLYAQVTVRRGDARTIVLWTRAAEPVQVRIPAETTQAILADTFGSRRAIAPRDGVYTVDLPACTQPFCVTGGAPQLLVEGAPPAAISPATIVPVQPTRQPQELATQFATQPTTTSTPEPPAPPTATPSPTLTPMPAAAAAPTLAPTAIQVVAPPTIEPLVVAPPSNPDALLIAVSVVAGMLLIASVLTRLSDTQL